MERYKSVNEYISSHKEWSDALKKLRIIILNTELQETIKWGGPVYTINNKNVVGLGAFISYVGLWFFQGVLLNDKKKRLVNAQEEVTKALRQLRFNSIDEINDKLVLEYINEAIKNQKEGKEIRPTKKGEIEIPSELTKEFNKN